MRQALVFYKNEIAGIIRESDEGEKKLTYYNFSTRFRF